MARKRGAPSASTLLRWTALIIVLMNVAFIVDYMKLASALSVADVVDKYGNALVPTAYAVALGATILVAFALFFVAALWPRRHRIPIYDRLVIPLAGVSVLASTWLV